MEKNLWPRLATGASFLLILMRLLRNPQPPALGLDASWIFALNEAVGKGLIFGKDIIFTLGPYSSMYTNNYHPATEALRGGGMMIFTIALMISFFTVFRKRPAPMVLAAAILFWGANTQDLLFVSYALFTFVSTYTIPKGTAKKWHVLEIPFLLGVLSLLPLIKLSFLVLVVALILSCVVLLWLKRERTAAVLSLVSVLGVPVVGWWLAGQPIGALPNYYASTIPIVSGYSDAMSTWDPTAAWQIGPYLCASVLILAIVLLHRGAWPERLIMLASLALFLLIGFKAGFVRHDAHAVTAATSLLILALVVQVHLGGRVLKTLMFVAAGIGFVFVQQKYLPINSPKLSADFVQNSTYFLDGLKNLRSGGALNAERYDLALAMIRKRNPLPQSPGTWDVYSFGQSQLIAAGVNWTPRPAVQSFVAYNRVLAEADREFLAGAKAPDNILFSVQPIDNHLPSLEDGPSWPALLSRYSVARYSRGAAHLRRLDKPSADMEFTESLPAKMGQEILVPFTDEAWFARLKVEPTTWGKLKSLAYKLPALSIDIRTAGGGTYKFRLIAGMASVGFLLSPLAKDSLDFVRLYSTDQSWKTRERVTSLAVRGDGDTASGWKSEFHLELARVRLPRRLDEAEIIDFETMVQPQESVSRGVCQGSIDLVDGSPFQAGVPRRSYKSLTVKGWSAQSLVDGRAPQATLLYFRKETPSSPTQYFTLTSSFRNDLGIPLPDPVIGDIGIGGVIDLRKMSGVYEMGLAQRENGRLLECENLTTKIEVSP